MSGMWLAGTAHNDHIVPRFVYRCTRADCPWESPPLMARVSAEAVRDGQQHPHPVVFDREVTP